MCSDQSSKQLKPTKSKNSEECFRMKDMSGWASLVGANSSGASVCLVFSV